MEHDLTMVVVANMQMISTSVKGVRFEGPTRGSEGGLTETSRTDFEDEILFKWGRVVTSCVQV